MSTTVAPTTTPGAHPTPTPAAPGRPRRASASVPASGVVRSEWIKLRSVRSSTTTLLAAGGVMVLIGAMAAASNSGLLASPPDGDEGDPTGIALTGSLLAPLVIGVLGVMTITSEHATGTIRSTMTFVPKRLPVLGAKVVVLTAVTLPVMVVSTLAAFLLGQLLLGAGDAPTAAIGDTGVLRTVLGTGGYLTGVALMGLALGTLLRGTAVAISVLFGLVFLLPGLGGFLLPASSQDALLYLPSNAADSFTRMAPDPGALSTTTGALVFAAWVVLPLLLAAVALVRRPV